MQRVLEGFLEALRANEVDISPAEAIDAHRAAAHVGFADRTLLRDCLCLALAKSETDVRRFETCFDRFFRREPLGERAGTSPARPFDLESALLDSDAGALSAAMERAAEDAGVADLRLSAQRSLVTRRLLDAMGLRGLERRIQALRADPTAESAQASRLEGARADLFETAGRYVEAKAQLYAGETGRRLRERLLAREKLTAISAEDLRAMQGLVRRMARRLAKRYARKRRGARKGRLDVRTTIRKSMGVGGVPFQVIWKRKTLEKPSIVAICDVSRSVAGAAGFLLLFLYSLHDVVERFDAFAFSDRLIAIGDLLEEHDVDDAIALVLGRIGFRPTDYGRALADFMAAHGSKLDRRTTVIILGDARSNYADPRADLMRRINERARAVVWLNPEPESYWGQGDSNMALYSRFCHLARSCNSLDQLDAIVERVLSNYLPH